MDPLTLSMLGSAFMGGGGSGGMGSMLAAAKPSSSATGGTAVSGGSPMNDSGWAVTFGSSGGGFSPTIAAGSVNWLMIAALVAAALWLTKKL